MQEVQTQGQYRVLDSSTTKLTNYGVLKFLIQIINYNTSTVEFTVPSGVVGNYFIFGTAYRTNAYGAATRSWVAI